MKIKVLALIFIPLLTGRCAPTNLTYSDSFQFNTSNWETELEKGGQITIQNGAMDINVPAGATIWFKPILTGPIRIEYKATAISAGGPNDRVSDLNCFWMAIDSRNRKDFFAVARTGKFADYNQLLCYYVGLGGNTNTTTRFRRYVGSATTRPIRPQDDLRDPSELLIPNHEQTIKLIANGKTIEFYRDDHRLFQMIDDQPYTSGYFGFRTTASHLQIREFKVTRLDTN